MEIGEARVTNDAGDTGSWSQARKDPPWRLQGERGPAGTSRSHPGLQNCERARFCRSEPQCGHEPGGSPAPGKRAGPAGGERSEGPAHAAPTTWKIEPRPTIVRGRFPVNGCLSRFSGASGDPPLGPQSSPPSGVFPAVSAAPLVASPAQCSPLAQCFPGSTARSLTIADLKDQDVTGLEMPQVCPVEGVRQAPFRWSLARDEGLPWLVLPGAMRGLHSPCPT